MSERIKALRTLYLLSPDELDEVFAHIDHLTAELARRQQQVEKLRAACINAKDALLRSNSRRRDALVRDAIDWLIVPMAATSEPGGEGTS